MSNKTFPEYIAEHLDIPFKWGVSDCIFLTMGWVKESTELDVISLYKPWRNKREAHIRMRESGGLVKIFDNLFDKVNPCMAIDGDLSVIGTTSYLFVGRHIVSVGSTGILFKDRINATCAWRCKKL